MENIVSNLRNKLTGKSFESNSDGSQSSSFRKIHMPEAKIGLGSTEGDLIAMGKKYLEIVGLVVFVWILGNSLKIIFSFIRKYFLCLGYFHFSISWILLAVFIYLFRQRQRTQFKMRHNMLNEINTNEEQYIKARLEELPSWVRQRKI